MSAKSSQKKSGGLNSSLEKLSVSSTSNKARSKAPPDSWEEEAAHTSNPSTPSASNTPTSPSTPIQDSSMPGPPPPTPMSPTHRHDGSLDWNSFSRTAISPPPRSSRHDSSSQTSERRPEKSSATAGRMIAGALGVKGPKMTEEQRQYEKTVRDKERRRIEKEKETARRAESEREEARRAVWDD